VNASLAFIEGAKPEGEVEGALVLGLRFSKAGVLHPSNAQDVLLLGHPLHGHQRYSLSTFFEKETPTSAGVIT
jgi:hypothetical protein